MNILLWVLQIAAGLLYGSSAVTKVFLFEKVSEGVPSFGALPKEGWRVLGILELICMVALVASGALHWMPMLTVLLAVESLVFVWVHMKYGEMTSIVMSAVPGLVMAFIAYGRIALSPLS
jgi:hypothetical protein